MNKNIWVLPDLIGGEISKTGLGLLSEANKIAQKAGGTVTAIVFGEDTPDYSGIFSQYGVSSVYLFQELNKAE